MEVIKKILSYLWPTAFRRGSRTVRYAFPIFFLSAALFGAALIADKNKSYVRIVVSEPVVLAGDTFWVDVYAYAHVPVNAVDVSLKFPNKQIKVTGIDVGQSVITLWTKDPTVTNDIVRLSGGTYNKGFLGEHLIATINMKALETGTAELNTSSIRLLAGDGVGSTVNAISDTVGTASLFIYDEDTDQETILAAANIRIKTDIDGDGKVNLKDISAFMAAWFSRNTTYDFNGDGRMTFVDFSIILSESFTH
ncbi:hypothetical protein KC723_02430 [Candidatus Kaiserbacteria bacterium]|nr:hypothetical protein [Candidatus Kaiserbacteria bacterium]